MVVWCQLIFPRFFGVSVKRICSESGEATVPSSECVRVPSKRLNDLLFIVCEAHEWLITLTLPGRA